MIKLMDILKDLFFEHKASSPSVKTGLPHKVCVLRNDPKNKHNRPRLKLNANDGTWWSITFDDNIQIIEGPVDKIQSKEWKSIVNWITLNKQGLEDVWNGKVEPRVFLRNAIKI